MDSVDDRAAALVRSACSADLAAARALLAGAPVPVRPIDDIDPRDLIARVGIDLA